VLGQHPAVAHTRVAGNRRRHWRFAGGERYLRWGYTGWAVLLLA